MSLPEVPGISTRRSTLRWRRAPAQTSTATGLKGGGGGGGGRGVNAEQPTARQHAARRWRSLLSQHDSFKLGKISMFAALATLSLSLQGCTNLVHTTAAWRRHPSYLQDFQYFPPGSSMSNGTLNSCEIPGLPADRVCSGRGHCVTWGSSKKENLKAGMDPYYTGEWDMATANKMSFCLCNRDWADPECRTRRKSQTLAYFLSLFLGLFGVDRFYLGFYLTGCVKLATFGGGTVWWVVDAVYIGASPPYADNYRLAYDLPHITFVASITLFFGLIGAFISTLVATSFRKAELRRWMLRQTEDAFHESRCATLLEKPMDTNIGMPTYCSQNVLTPIGYGAVEEPWLGKVSFGNPWSPWWIRRGVDEKTANRYNGRLQEPPQAQYDLALHEAAPVCSIPVVPHGFKAHVREDGLHPPQV